MNDDRNEVKSISAVLRDSTFFLVIIPTVYGKSFFSIAELRKSISLFINSSKDIIVEERCKYCSIQSNVSLFPICFSLSLCHIITIILAYKAISFR